MQFESARNHYIFSQTQKFQTHHISSSSQPPPTQYSPMAAMAKASSRYTSFNSHTSTSSSTDHTSPSVPKSNSNSLARVKPRPEQNFTTLVRKFMEKKTSRDRTALPLIVPADFIAQDLKKTLRKAPGSTIAALPKKLFGKSGDKGASGDKKVKALTDVKVNTNTRTLAMVLRSERELLCLNKEQEIQISELNALLHNRNNEVDKLKDLCLKQREEIKALKSAILFPDEMKSQLQVLLEEQGSELKQAQQVIPTLQMQISSLTGQLQNLSQDLAQVKADKHSPNTWSQGGSFSSPRTLPYDCDDAMNSLEFSSCDAATPGSPAEDMYLKDFNPCLTPHYIKEKIKGFQGVEYGYDALEDEKETFMETRSRTQKLDFGIEPKCRKLSRSSDYSQKTMPGRSGSRSACRSDDRKYMNH